MHRDRIFCQAIRMIVRRILLPQRRRRVVSRMGPAVVRLVDLVRMDFRVSLERFLSRQLVNMGKFVVRMPRHRSLQRAVHRARVSVVPVNREPRARQVRAFHAVVHLGLRVAISHLVQKHPVVLRKFVARRQHAPQLVPIQLVA